jgi:hypothetical protein
MGGKENFGGAAAAALLSVARRRLRWEALDTKMVWLGINCK